VGCAGIVVSAQSDPPVPSPIGASMIAVIAAIVGGALVWRAARTTAAVERLIAGLMSELEMDPIATRSWWQRLRLRGNLTRLDVGAARSSPARYPPDRFAATRTSAASVTDQSDGDVMETWMEKRPRRAPRAIGDRSVASQ
jgi:hypothetical protein